MKKTYAFCILAGALTLGSCEKFPDYELLNAPVDKGLFPIVKLDTGVTVIYLKDYFKDRVDSFSIEGCEYVMDYPNQRLSIGRILGDSSMLRELKVWCRSRPHVIMVQRRDDHELLIEIPDQGYKKVQVKGEFNGWNPEAGGMRRAGGSWRYSAFLPRGTYQYRLVFDGTREGIDPTNPLKVKSDMGGHNSLAEVALTGKKPPLLTTLEAGAEDFSILVERKADKVFVLWENQRLLPPHIRRSDSIMRIAVPRKAEEMERSYVRVFAYNDIGVSNDLLIPLRYGKVITKPKHLTRRDPHTQIMYSIMVDRFMNGSKRNDFRINSPDVLPQVDYFGGDLAGITQKIKKGYFKKLGVNTLWLSPLMQNPYDAWGQLDTPRTKFSGYHGYWPLYLTQVDKRFGTDSDLHRLLKAAHRRNMNVIVDYVAHHVHVNSPVAEQHPGWKTPLVLPDSSLNLERWDDHRLTTWFDLHLPTLDLSLPEAAEPMSDSALFWLKKFDLDGFRHDAAKHVDPYFWRLLTQKIKAQVNRPIYQIGETYGSTDLIRSYVGPGLFDAQFDFNLYDAALRAMAGGGSMRRLWEVLEQSLSTYGSHNLMGNISGNHDRVRFISHAGRAVKLNEDGKAAGWRRPVGVGDTVAYRKMGLLHALIFTVPGVPCIYYGDEYGQPGANDPDNRRPMRFDSYSPAEQDVIDQVKRLAALRATHLPLIYGDTEQLFAGTDVLVLARTYFGQIVVTVINNANQPVRVQVQLPEGYHNARLKSNFRTSHLTQDDTWTIIEVQRNNFDVLTNR